MLFQQQLVPDPTKERFPYATCQEPRFLIFGLSFLLLPSPVLKKSLLVSCPPLNNMLKFSGCSFLRSAQKFLKKQMRKFKSFKITLKIALNQSKVKLNSKNSIHKKKQSIYWFITNQFGIWCLFEWVWSRNTLICIRVTICVQEFDDSLNPAIHTTYRISLRSSSLREPRDPLLRIYNNSVW